MKDADVSVQRWMCVGSCVAVFVLKSVQEFYFIYVLTNLIFPESPWIRMFFPTTSQVSSLFYVKYPFRFHVYIYVVAGIAAAVLSIFSCLLKRLFCLSQHDAHSSRSQHASHSTMVVSSPFPSALRDSTWGRELCLLGCLGFVSLVGEACRSSVFMTSDTRFTVFIMNLTMLAALGVGSWTLLADSKDHYRTNAAYALACVGFYFDLAKLSVYPGKSFPADGSWIVAMQAAVAGVSIMPCLMFYHDLNPTGSILRIVALQACSAGGLGLLVVCVLTEFFRPAGLFPQDPQELVLIVVAGLWTMLILTATNTALRWGKPSGVGLALLAYPLFTRMVVLLAVFVQLVLHPRPFHLQIFPVFEALAGSTLLGSLVLDLTSQWEEVAHSAPPCITASDAMAAEEERLLPI